MERVNESRKCSRRCFSKNTPQKSTTKKFVPFESSTVIENPDLKIPNIYRGNKKFSDHSDVRLSFCD